MSISFFFFSFFHCCSAVKGLKWYRTGSFRIFPTHFYSVGGTSISDYQLKFTETSLGYMQVCDTVEIHHHWLVPLGLSDNFGNELLLDCSFISLSLFKHSLHQCSHLAIAALWKRTSQELWSIPIPPFMVRRRSPKISFCYKVILVWKTFRITLEWAWFRITVLNELN